MNNHHVTWTASETKISQFIKENKPYMYKACNASGLPRADWNLVVQNVAIKFAKGQIEFNEARGAKISTLIYKITKNCAIDVIRGMHPERIHDMEDKDWDRLAGSRDYCDMESAEDMKLILPESLRRLARECDRTKVELVVRYGINGEKRELFAEEYGIEADYVSLVKTRYLPRLKRIMREVMEEEEAGKLKLSNTDIAFLKPYMNW